MGDTNIPLIHRYASNKSLEEEENEEEVAYYTNLKFYLMLSMIIIVLQSTVICFLIVNLVNRDSSLVTTEAIETLREETILIAPEPKNQNKTELELELELELEPELFILDTDHYTVDSSTIEYFQEHVNEILEEYGYIKFESDIDSFSLLDSIVISSDVTIESEHEVKIKCPDLSQEMFHITNSSRVNMIMFKIENCDVLHVPIIVLEDDSDLNLDHFKITNLESNVTLFEVNDQSSLQFTNSEINDCASSEYLINSKSSIISFNYNTTIQSSSTGIIKAKDSYILINDLTFSYNILNNEKLIDAINAIIIIKDSEFTFNEGNEGGIIVTSEHGSLQIEDSIFLDNRIKLECSCIDINDQSFVTMTNVTAEGNYANINGGFACISNSDTNITYSIFKSNEVEGNSSVIKINDSFVNINSTEFIENISNTGSGALLFQDSNYNIVDTVLYGNSAITGSCIQQMGNSVGYVSFAQFYDNQGDFGSTFFISSGQLTLENSAITNNKARLNAAGIYSRDGTNIKIKKCEFLENNSLEDTGAIYTYKSDISIENSQFQNCMANGIAGALKIDSSTLNIQASKFMTNYAKNDAGAIQIEYSDFKLIDTDFDSNLVASGNGNGNGNGNGGGGGALVIYNSDDGFIKRCLFIGNEASYGGAIYLKYGNIIMEESNFENNEAIESLGGAFHAINCNATISKCEFNQNFANKDAGAVFATDATILIENSNFESNECEFNGGAISTEETEIHITKSKYIDNKGSTGGSLHSKESSIFISNTSFISNIADISGGALAQINTKSGKSYIENCDFNENIASAGPAIYAANVYPLNVKLSNFNNNKATSKGCVYLTEMTEAYFMSCNFTGNSLAVDGGVISADNYVDIYLGNSTFNDNEAVKGGIFYITGKLCSLEVEYCYMINNKAIYGWLGYLDGRGTHLVNVAFTVSFNNINENGGKDGVYVNDGTDETTVIDIITIDKGKVI